MNHLINTAYYTKRKLTTDEEFQPLAAFFDHHFAMFKGKHTDWLLLSEPDKEITPVILNSRYSELLTMYDEQISGSLQNKKRITDFNLLAQ